MGDAYIYKGRLLSDSDRSGILFAARIMHLRFLEHQRKNTAGAEQQRQKDTSGKRGAAFCFCKVVINKMQQSAIKREESRKNNCRKGGFCKYEEQIPHEQIGIRLYLFMASFCLHKNIAAAKNHRHPWRKQRRRFPHIYKNRYALLLYS